MISKGFINELLGYRLSKNWTQEELCSNIPYSSSYLSKLERGDIEETQQFVNKVTANLGFSPYNALVAFNGRSMTRKFTPPLGGIELGENEMISFLDGSQYSISALFPFYKDYFIKQNEKSVQTAANITELCVKSSIPEDRIMEIANSYNSHYRVSLADTLRICSVLNKRFHDLFAITTLDITDNNTLNIAVTVANYIEKHKTKVLRFNDIDDKLTDDEINYLEKSLIVYRTLKLKPDLR